MTEAIEHYGRQAAAAYALRALAATDAITGSGNHDSPRSRSSSISSTKAIDSSAATSPRRRLPSEQPMPSIHKIRPMDGGPRDPALVTAEASQPQAPREAAEANADTEPANKVFCVCKVCILKEPANGKWVSKKTKNEHEHADLIEENGEELYGENRCQRCISRGFHCFEWSENSSVCSSCVRHKEKCPWRGQSARKRDVERRQQQAERAARLAHQNETPSSIDNHNAVQQPTLDQNEHSSTQSLSNSKEKNRDTTPSRRSSGSQTAGETSVSSTHKRRRANSSASTG
ncbi:hypothetical protein ColTof4_03433 [Colletotrichum tofieldiae]|nr:hypothetical protein ColTof4_03433 [Colletotrichum tofieldiae]